ncbi:Vacuolar protein sorting-associated protein 35B [Trifolium repens]|nr:Vacuolar protein sorting-associated protein 35B [Trifolium repens]
MDSKGNKNKMKTVFFQDLGTVTEDHRAVNHLHYRCVGLSTSTELQDLSVHYSLILVWVLPKFLQVEAFTKLSTAISRVIEAQVDMPIVGAISLHISLITFTLGVHPDRLDYVDQVLVCCFSNTEASS